MSRVVVRALALVSACAAVVVPSSALAAPAPWGDPDETYGANGRVAIGGLDADVQTGDLDVDGSGRGVLSASQAQGGGSAWLLATLQSSGAPTGPVNAVSLAAATTSPPLLHRRGTRWLQAGGTGSSWTILRRQADGTDDAGDPDTPFPHLDDSFSGSGLTDVRVRALITQSVEPGNGDDPYDRLVVVGDGRSASGGRAIAVGYRPAAGGGLERDPSFATTITPAVPTVGGAALSNGRIVIGGYDGDPGQSGNHVRVMRLEADGAVDSAFGTKSYAFISDLPNVAPGTTDTGRIENIAIDHQDRILLVGSGSAQRPMVYAGSHAGEIVENGAMRVIRLTPAGAMDPSFAGDGNRTRQFTYVYGTDGTLSGQAAVVDSLDRVTVTGYATNWEGTESHITLIRLNTNGFDSMPFGISGEQASVFGAGYGEALAFEPGGKLLVGGETTGAIVAQRYQMEDSGDVLEPEPVGASVSVSNGFVQVQDASAHQVDLLVTQSGRTLTFRERRDGLELVAGDGCTQDSAVLVSCADVDGMQFTLDDGSDKLTVDPAVTYPVGANLGEGDDAVTLATPTSGANEINAGDGDDTITGAAGRDRLFGEGGADTLTGAGGDDDLYGEHRGCGCAGGDDTLDGGAGFDRLLGGEGDDSLSGGADNDALTGGTGADDISSGTGNDLVDLGSADGATRVRGGDGANDGQLDIDAGTAGNQSEGDDYAADFEAFWGSDDADDVVIPAPNSTPGDPITLGNGGNDVIVASSSSDQLYGGDGDDEIHGGGGSDSLYGDDQPEQNDAHAGNDKLYGDEGADALIGGNGADLLDGGVGDQDSLYGEWAGDVDFTTADADHFIGGPGSNDAVRLGYAGDQNVTLDGVANDGRDDEDDNVDASVELVLTGSGDDHLTGTPDAQQLFGGAGDDVIEGAGGDDSLHGEAGEDTLRGGPGADAIYGGTDADAIDGGTDADQIDAGSGDDEVTGGAGIDLAFGGGGADVLRMRDDAVDQTVHCGDDADRAVIDAGDPATACETVDRPVDGGDNGGGGQPQPTTPVSTTPNGPGAPAGPGTPAAPGESVAPDAPAPAAGASDAGPLLCATRLDLYVRGSVGLGAGTRDGFALHVSSIASGVTLGGTLTDAGSGAVLATAAPALSPGGEATVALRFSLTPGAADKLAAADTRVALEATAGASGCPTVRARDELTVTRSGGAAAKAILRGRVQGAAGLTALRTAQPFSVGAGPSAVDPAAQRSQTYTVAVCTALAAGISLERGPCKVPKQYPPLPPSPQPACVGALSLGGLQITGPCLKRDPKSGVYTAYTQTGSGVGEILLNGIRIVPVAGGQISVDPAKLVLRTKGRVAVSVGGMTVFEGSPQWSLGTKAFSIGKASGSLAIKGFKVSGSVGLRFSPAKEAGAAQPPLGGAVVEVSVELPTPPPPQGGKKGKLSASLGIRVNSAGQISLNDLAINVPKFTAGPIEVLPMTIRYAGKTDTWSGAARVVLPSPAKPRPQVGASFTYAKGRLTSARVTAVNANLPFGPPPSAALTKLQMIDAAFKYEDALSLNGAVGFSVDTPPVAGRSKRLAELILTAGYNFKAPGQWAGSGVFKMLGDELGHAKVEYWNGGKLSFDVAAKRTFGFGMTLGVEGSIKGAIERGTLTGTGKTKVTTGPFSAGGTVTLSDKTLVACLDGYPGAGGTYVLETKQLKLFEGCGNPSLKDAVKKAKEDYDNLKKAKNAPKAKKSQAAPDGVISVGQFSVAGDLPFTVLAVEGQGGVPQGAFVAPNGTRYAAPAAGQSAPVGGGFALSDPQANRVYLSITRPAAGLWTFDAAPGSVPLAAGLQSDGDDEPKVRANVTGKGASRTVEYDADLPEGMTVRFREDGEETTQDLGSPRGSGAGEVRFTPADSASRARKIVALLEREGALVGTEVVASFRATTDGRPGRVSDLRVSRAGDDALRVRFDGADDADGHRIVVRLGDGGEQVVDLDGGARSALIEGVERDVSATVTVQGVNDGGIAGPAASKRIAAGKPRLQKLPNAPADGSLGVAEVVFAQLG